MRKQRLAIAGLTACSGCQLSLLNCEAELAGLLEFFEFSFFPMACSPVVMEGEYDVALVEGCVSMPHEQELLLELRRRSRCLVALGTCAVCGGVAASGGGESRDVLRRKVYGAAAVALDTADPLPLERVVTVDAAVSGCPPEKDELLRLLAGLSRGVIPVEIDYPVCSECRMRENLCLLTERNALCLGPLTCGGCRARCPGLNVPCEGCRGPVPEANLDEYLEVTAQNGFDREEVLGRLHRFSRRWTS